MSSPIIEKIELTPEQLEEIDKLTKGITVPKKKIITNKLGYSYESTSNRVFSRLIAKKRLTAIYGGSCCVCGNWPDYKILYDVEGAKRIERYCQKDYEERIK